MKKEDAKSFTIGVDAEVHRGGAYGALLDP
jgi:hypothetical protein